MSRTFIALLFGLADAWGHVSHGATAEHMAVSAVCMAVIAYTVAGWFKATRKWSK